MRSRFVPRLLSLTSVSSYSSANDWSPARAIACRSSGCSVGRRASERQVDSPGLNSRSSLLQAIYGTIAGHHLAKPRRWAPRMGPAVSVRDELPLGVIMRRRSDRGHRLYPSAEHVADRKPPARSPEKGDGRRSLDPIEAVCIVRSQKEALGRLARDPRQIDAGGRLKHVDALHDQHHPRRDRPAGRGGGCAAALAATARVARTITRYSPTSAASIEPRNFVSGDERRTLRRPRKSVTKKAIHRTPAMAAVMRKFRGETSHDVSETIRPKAKQENRIGELHQPG